MISAPNKKLEAVVTANPTTQSVEIPQDSNMSTAIPSKILSTETQVNNLG